MNIKEKQVYKHFKGNLYIIICVGVHTETEEEMVVYKSLKDDKIWIRPKYMFMEKVDKNKYPNITQKYRFELIKKGELNE